MPRASWIQNSRQVLLHVPASCATRRKKSLPAWTPLQHAMPCTSARIPDLLNLRMNLAVHDVLTQLTVPLDITGVNSVVSVCLVIDSLPCCNGLLLLLAHVDCVWASVHVAHVPDVVNGRAVTVTRHKQQPAEKPCMASSHKGWQFGPHDPVCLYASQPCSAGTVTGMLMASSKDSSQVHTHKLTQKLGAGGTGGGGGGEYTGVHPDQG
jgi:hypothetical protein